MSQTPEEDRYEIEDDILNELDLIDDSLVNQIGKDARFDSGVPSNQRVDEVDFIEMSGLVSPGIEPDDVQDFDNVLPDTDTSRPLSFFEKGVADVDASMTPGALEVESEPEITSAQGETVPGLRQMLESQRRFQSASRDAAPIIVDDVDEGIELQRTEPATPSSIRDEIETVISVAPPSLPGVVSGHSADVDYDPDNDNSDLLAMSEVEKCLAELETSVASTPPSPPVSKPSRPAADQSAATQRRDLPARPQTPVNTNQPIIRPSSLLSVVNEGGETLNGHDTRPNAGQDSSLNDDRIFMEDEDAAEEDGVWGTPTADDTIYEKEKAPGSRKRRKSGRRQTRIIVKLLFVFFVACLFAMGAYYGYTWFKRNTASAGALLAEAHKMEQEGHFTEAYMAYRSFVKRYPNDPFQADAQFLAAVMLQLSAENAGAGAPSVYEEAIKELQTFISERPDHPKTARAETLIGMLLYRLGRYEEAVNQLRGRSLQQQDAAATLAILRTLAKCHMQLGDTQQAISNLTQAASLPENATPDADYDELGNIYMSMVEKASSDGERKRLRGEAVKMWRNALQTPAIAPATRDQIQSKLALADGTGAGTADSIGSPDVVDAQPAPPPLEAPSS